MARESHLSLSAAYVAYLTAWHRQHPEFAALLPQGAGEATTRLLRACALLPPRLERLLASERLSALARAFEKRTAPGQLFEIALRRRLVEDEARDALDQGVAQLVCVGGGFDTLCARLAPLYPQARFWEIDHPATGRRKAEGLRRLGWTRPNFELVHGDLRRLPLESWLSCAGGFRAKQRTLMVAEGLLMYLSRAEAERFFRSACKVCATGSTLVFSYLGLDSAGRPALGRRPWLIRSLLGLAGEPIGWGSDQAQLDTLLNRHGFEATEKGRWDLQERYGAELRGGTLALGVERTMVATRRA